MPTAYTAGVLDGTTQEFHRFAMQCARAFGALITLRDESFDAPIPEEFRPDSYYEANLIRVKGELTKLDKMTLEEAELASSKDYQEALKSAEKYNAALSLEDARCHAMIAKVQAWQPPTPDHVGMKTFMLEQLNISLHGDYKSTLPVKLDGAAWLDIQIQSTNKSIEYYEKELAKEVERVKGRTEWVQQLRASLVEPK